jgi:hypothetical protein
MNHKYNKENRNSSYRILKLQSGEEIIAKISGRKTNKIILDKPMLIKSSTQSDMFGRTKEIIFLRKWICGTTSETTNVPENFILSWHTPSKEVMYMYNMEAEMDKMKDSDPWKPKNINPQKNDYLQSLLDDLQKDKDSGDFVFMNMALPPDLAKELFEDGGLFDIEDDDDDDDDFMDEEEVNEHLYTGDDIKDPDYGNRWTDWNPDPSNDEYH